MFNKIKGYFRKIRQEKKKNREKLYSMCACQDCSYFSKCMKAEKENCRKAIINDIVFYIAICSLICIFQYHITHYGFVDKLHDCGFTAQQIERILTK